MEINHFFKAQIAMLSILSFYPSIFLLQNLYDVRDAEDFKIRTE